MFADAAERKLHPERVQQTHRPTPRPPDEEVQSGQVTLTAACRPEIKYCTMWWWKLLLYCCGSYIYLKTPTTVCIIKWLVTKQSDLLKKHLMWALLKSFKHQKTSQFFHWNILLKSALGRVGCVWRVEKAVHSHFTNTCYALYTACRTACSGEAFKKRQPMQTLKHLEN